MIKATLFGLLVSATALASTPKIGDTATYDFHVSQAPGMVGAVTWTISSLDQTGNTSTISQAITFGGRTQTSNVTATYQSLAAVDQLVAQCAAHNGTLEGIDVPAGHFETCRITQEDAQYVRLVWFGNVPVRGFVKFQQTAKANNNVTEFDLRSHSAL